MSYERSMMDFMEWRIDELEQMMLRVMKANPKLFTRAERATIIKKRKKDAGQG